MADEGSVADHAWRIEEREYARHESRRGRRFAYPSLDPRRTALVTVDVVPFFVEQNPYCRGIVPRINRLVGGVRTAGGTVAWVVPTVGAPSDWMRDFYGEQVATTYAATSTDRGSAGGGSADAETPSIRSRLWPGLDVEEADVMAEKPGPSSFFPGRSTLHASLEDREIDTVVVTGTLTNVCVESTVRDAAALGYRVILLGDGCAAMRDADHNATLHVVYRSFGDVRSSDEVLGLLSRPG